MTWFLITIAPPLLMFACILVVFLWATYAKPPAFVLEDQEELNAESINKASNKAL